MVEDDSSKMKLNYYGSQHLSGRIPASGRSMRRYILNTRVLLEVETIIHRGPVCIRMQIQYSVTVRWIIDTLNYLGCTVGRVVRLCQRWLSPGKTTRFPVGEIRNGTIQLLKNLLQAQQKYFSYLLDSREKALIYSSLYPIAEVVLCHKKRTKNQ